MTSNTQQDKPGREAPAGPAYVLALLRRRRTLFVTVAVLVPLAAIAFSLTQRHLYQATAKVLLSRQNLANSLTGTPDSTLQSAQVGDFNRYAATQASLAKSPIVAGRVLQAVGLTDRTPVQLLNDTTVTPETTTDIVDFAVTDPNRRLARRLADEYAHQYTIYRLQLDTSSLARAQREVTASLARLRRQGQTRSALYLSLQGKQQELQTLQALQTSNATVVPSRPGADQVQPQPLRDVLIGLGLGVVLAFGLALLRDALDTRVRTAEEAGDLLGATLLAQLPAPAKALSENDELVSVAEPGGAGAEAFRMLRTGLAFARLSRGIKTIMVTSAIETEGKSTTAANLAVTLARGGQRVVLVDCDFRRSFVWKLFKVEERPGVTEVVLGHETLDDVLIRVPVAETLVREPADSNGHVPAGTLTIARAGSLPPNPGEFVGAVELARVLATLAREADTVIIDAPPLLHVGDALTLAAHVDGILMVTRLRRVTRSMLGETRRLLDTVPKPLLGYVTTDAEMEATYGYYAYGASAVRAKSEEPVAG